MSEETGFARQQLPPKRKCSLKKGMVRVFPETGTRYKVVSVSCDCMLVRAKRIGDERIVSASEAVWLRQTEAG